MVNTLILMTFTPRMVTANSQGRSISDCARSVVPLSSRRVTCARLRCGKVRPTMKPARNNPYMATLRAR